MVEIFSLFLIVQFGGFLVAYFSIPPSYLTVITSAQQVSGNQGVLFAAYVIFLIIIFSIVLLFVMKMYKGAFLFKAFEAYAIGLPSAFLFYLLVADFFPYLDTIYIAGTAIILAASLVIAKNRWPNLRNLAVVISGIGIGVVIGIDGFTIAYVLMALLAVYDYLAVFVTKHMQVMAKAMAERNLAFLIGSSDVEMIPRTYLSQKERSEIKANIRKTGVKNPAIKRMIAKGALPQVSQVALGAGDLALPLMLTVGAYISFANTFIPVMAILGAAAGLLITMQILSKYKVPLPAIPPLFASMNLFLGIALLLSGSISIIGSLSFIALFFVIMWLLLITLRRNSNAMATA